MELKDTSFTKHVTIVSAFGRGHWLAAALLKEGLQVTLLDVSSQLGVWPSEDVEGPFGFFRTDRLSPLQLERIFADDHYDEVSNGFTLWGKEGPIEFKSPLTGFYFEKKNWSQDCFQFLSAASPASSVFYRSLDAFQFDRQWVVHFAHQWASTTYRVNAQSAQGGHSLPLTSTFCVRNATRQGLEKSLAWLREKGAEVLTRCEFRDLSFAVGKQISGFELAGEKQGVFKTDQLIWSLTSEESYFLNEKVAKKLYPEGSLEPEWCWVRYRMTFDESIERNSLPLHWVQLADVFSPWTHENMLVLQRTSLPDQFDVWLRLPNVQRFNKEYLMQHGEALCARLHEKLDNLNPQIQTFPQEYYYTYSQLGASRYPVFAEKNKQQRGAVLYSNLHLDGPEVWKQYSWESIFHWQEDILVNIVHWWKQALQKHQKQQLKKGS